MEYELIEEIKRLQERAAILDRLYILAQGPNGERATYTGDKIPAGTKWLTIASEAPIKIITSGPGMSDEVVTSIGDKPTAPSPVGWICLWCDERFPYEAGVELEHDCPEKDKS